MHMVNKKDLNSAELGTMKTSRSPTTVMTATARCKQEKKLQFLSNNWTHLSKLCFLKKLPQYFPSGNSARIMSTHSTGSASTSHQTWQ